MGKNRCGRVRMNALGYMGHGGHTYIQEEGKKGVFMVVQVRIGVLWPGKFPRT